MARVAIVGNGPKALIPDLSLYRETIDIWIGADRGTLTLIEQNKRVNYALGDFDSINDQEKQLVMDKVDHIEVYKPEKDETDIELALKKAFTLKPSTIYLFGVTGGRLDHELINIQLLHTIVERDIEGIIIDQYNFLQLTLPGKHRVNNDSHFPHISFIPFSKEVIGLTLEGFYYPLKNKNISWGSTLCISNKLIGNYGTFLYEEGILLLIKSREANLNIF